MASVYDFDIQAYLNNAAAPDGFPEGMLFRDYNAAMRELMAVRARQLLDTTTRPAAYTPGPDGVGSDIEVSISQIGTLNDPPAGFMLTLELPSPNPNPLWLTINGGPNRYSVRGPDGRHLLPGALRAARYRLIFLGDHWRIVGNLKGSRTTRSVRRLNDPSSITLDATDVMNTVAFFNTLGTSVDVTLIVPDTLLDRWPIGADIEFVNFVYSGTIALAIDSAVVVPSTSTLANGNRDLAVNTITNSFTYFKLLRTAELEVQVALPPRFQL